ncbi:MAG: hypothetical protein D6722_29565 [Bacteroidetes bacterium]|nr:MAG: hypothetical protein D6722_29565 [Bacteroidota bacterium]
MRNLLISILFLGCITPLMGQDVIIRKNGLEIEAEVLRVDPEEVLYKRWDNLDGPEFVLQRAQIVLIRYADGRVQIMEEDFYESEEEEGAELAQPESEEWPGTDRIRRQAIGWGLLSYLAGHQRFTYQRMLSERLTAEVELGIVGIGQRVRPAYRNEQVFSGGSILDAKEDEQGFFVQLGPKWKLTNRERWSLQGVYLRPELNYSYLRVQGQAYQRNGQPNDYDYTFTFSGHTLGVFVGGGYQLLLADLLLLDAYAGMGFVRSFDHVNIEGLAAPNQPVPLSDGPTFRYSHQQFAGQGGIALTLGLAASFAF